MKVSQVLIRLAPLCFFGASAIRAESYEVVVAVGSRVPGEHFSDPELQDIDDLTSEALNGVVPGLGNSGGMQRLTYKDFAAEGEKGDSAGLEFDNGVRRLNCASNQCYELCMLGVNPAETCACCPPGCGCGGQRRLLRNVDPRQLQELQSSLEEGVKNRGKQDNTGKLQCADFDNAKIVLEEV